MIIETTMYPKNVLFWEAPSDTPAMTDKLQVYSKIEIASQNVDMIWNE